MTCSVDGCDRTAKGRGWCMMHYKRWRNRGTTDPLVRTKASDRPCSINNCDAPQRARGYCATHWGRWDRYGDPEATTVHTLSIEARLLVRTHKTEDCWLWEGAVTPTGYGIVCWRDASTTIVHRIAYKLWVGPLPDDLEVDHLCSVRNCVRPEHLEAVDRAENNRRRWERYWAAQGGRPVCEVCGGAKRRTYLSTCSRSCGAVKSWITRRS